MFDVQAFLISCAQIDFFAVVKIKVRALYHVQLVNTLVVERWPVTIVRRDFLVQEMNCHPQSLVETAHTVYQLGQLNVWNVLLERVVCIAISRL